MRGSSWAGSRPIYLIKDSEDEQKIGIPGESKMNIIPMTVAILLISVCEGVLKQPTNNYLHCLSDV